jgi:hypothetical protein
VTRRVPASNAGGLTDLLLTVWMVSGLTVAGVGNAHAQVVRAHLNVSGGMSPEVENSPSIAVLGKNIAAVWSHGVLASAISRDGGITWADSIIQLNPPERVGGRASTCIDSRRTAFCAAIGLDTQGTTIFLFIGAFDEPTWRWQRRPNILPFIPFGGPGLDGIRMVCDRSTDILYLAYTRGSTIQLVRSTDSGESWTNPLDLSGTECHTAQLALGPEGEVYVVWEDYEQGAIVGRKSTDQGVNFGEPFTLGVIHDNVSFGPPGRQDLSRGALLPNIDCMDFPAFLGLAVDTSEGPNRGTIYGVWTDHAQGAANPDPVRTVFETEPNDGPGNATPIEIGDDFAGVSSGTEHESDDDWFTFEGTAGTTIQVTGAVTYCSPVVGCREIPSGFGLLCGDDPAVLTQVGCGSVYGPSPIPPAIYTLPTTGRYYLNVGSGAGPYSFKLREYVVDPVSVARDHRDVVLVRSTDGGATWSQKIRVNDDAPMYDNAIPAVTVDGSGRVHVAWYDRREEPECGARVHTYWTYSEDGGATFQPSRRVSQQPSEGGRRYDGPGQVNTWQVGDHMALSADGDLVYLLWTQIAFGGSDGEILGVVIGDPIPGGINLSWDDCGAAGGAIKSFACDSNTGQPAVAVASFVPPPGVGQFLGASAEIRIGTDTATLPDWWRHGTGQCRGGTGLALAYTFAEGPYTCTEYGLGQAGGTHSYEVGYGDVNRARLLVQYVVPKEDVGPLNPGTEYYAFKVSLPRTKTTGTGQCMGCLEPACIELHSIQLHQPAAVLYSPVLIQPLNRNFVSWQGQAWTCDVATPVLGSLVSAEARTNEVRVVWETQAPEASVYRREGEADWTLRARLTPDGVGRVAHVDRDVAPGARYGYRLGVSVEGREVYFGETELTVPLAELEVRSLRRASGLQDVLLMLSLYDGSPAKVDIYDVAGRLWGSRKVEGLDAGRHEVSISGRQRLSPGVYFIRLAQGSRMVTRRFPVP